MESIVPNRPLTFRVENIPPGTTAEELKKYFYTEDQPHVQVRSIVPAVDNYESDIKEYTATVTFQAPNRMVPFPRVLDDNISMDSDFHGFTPLNHPQEPIVADIIAVTGLAAHAFGSWAHSAQNMWLRDYLPRDVSNARVLIYGYPSQLQGNISRSILSDHSTNLIHRLLTMRDSAKCQDRPIVFIGHSLGCLIIKKALCDINGSVGVYSSRLPVRSIIFLGAPHKGLQTTALETLVKSQPTEDMIRELRAESPTLTELNDKFRHVAKDIDILTCYELCPTKTAIKMPDGSWKREGPPEMMVSLDSARQWYPREKLVACNADHSQIAKLKRGESSIYPSVRWAIKQAMLSAGDLYNEAKIYNHGSTMHTAHEPHTAHPSFLQTSNPHSSVPLELRPTGPAEGQPRSRSEDAIDQQIRQLHTLRMDHNGHRGQGPNPIHHHLDQTVSQWQSGLEDYSTQDIRSQSSPSISTEKDMTSSVFDVHGSASKSPGSSTSAGTEVGRSPESLQANPDSQQQSTPTRPKSPVPALKRPKSGAKPDIQEEISSPLLLKQAAPTPSKSPPGANVTNQQESSHGSVSPTASTIPLEPPAPTQLEHSGSNMSVQSQDIDSHSTNRGAKSTTYDVEMKTAIVKGDEQKTLELLANKFDVNCKDEYGVTPLHDAAEYRHEHLVKILLEHKALPKAKTIAGDTTLHSLTFNPNDVPLTESMIDLLLQDRPPLDASNKEGVTPLMYAALNGEEQLAMKLIYHGADIRAVDKYGHSVLHYVVFKGKNPAMITHFFKEGVPVDARDILKQTPLHIAAQYCLGSADTAERLLQAGADSNARDHENKTPLHIATQYCLSSAETAERLLKAGADSNARDNTNRTPLHIAAQYCLGSADTAECLLKAGADSNARDGNNWTPLHFSASHGNILTVKMLLEHGANPHARRDGVFTRSGDKPRSCVKSDVSPDAKIQISEMLKEAEQAWKRSGKKK